MKQLRPLQKELEMMRKKPKLTEEDRTCLNVLWKFRNFHSKAVDCNPQQLITMNQLVELSQKRPKSVDEVGKILRSDSTFLRKSFQTIVKLIAEGDSFFERIVNITCNNCLRTGHAAFACWEEYSNENKNRFYRLHPDLKKAKNRKVHERYKRNLRARRANENL